MKQTNKLIIAIAIIIFLLFLYIGKNMLERRIYYTKEMDMYLTVSNYTGFNVDTDAIYFGTVGLGGSSKRIITIYNLNITSKINIEKEGKLAKWVRLDQEEFVMEPDENKNISVSAIVPVNIQYGNYSGKLKILFRRI